jgi:hypothetical protein
VAAPCKTILEGSKPLAGGKKAVYDGLEEPGNELLLEWRPPATSSALYLIRPENLASGDADDLAICSNMILRERDLIHLIHG